MAYWPQIDERRTVDGTWQQVYVSEDITIPLVSPYSVKLREVPDDGTVNVIPSVSGYSITSTYPPVDNTFYCNYVTGTVAFPAAVAGMNIFIYNTGAYTITIDPNGSDVIVRDGTAQTGGVSITLSSGAGNYVVLIADAANHWVTLGYKGTLAQGS